MSIQSPLSTLPPLFNSLYIFTPSLFILIFFSFHLNNHLWLSIPNLLPSTASSSVSTSLNPSPAFLPCASNLVLSHELIKQIWMTLCTLKPLELELLSRKTSTSSSSRNVVSHRPKLLHFELNSSNPTVALSPVCVH